MILSRINHITNPLAAKRDKTRFPNVLLLDQITVIKNEMCV